MYELLTNLTFSNEIFGLPEPARDPQLGIEYQSHGQYGRQDERSGDYICPILEAIPTSQGNFFGALGVGLGIDYDSTKTHCAKSACKSGTAGRFPRTISGSNPNPNPPLLTVVLYHPQDASRFASSHPMLYQHNG